MLWGGRFSEKLDDAAMRFSSSLPFDINLIKEDLAVSRAHAAMLGECGIIGRDDAEAIAKGLTQVEKEWDEGQWQPSPQQYEDIHSAVEGRLTEIIGAPAGKLHTGRSRNDQVATGMRLWVKRAADSLASSLTVLQTTLLTLAKDHTRTLMPGYTHLQRAQPVSFAFHLLAYVEMLQRDKERVAFVMYGSDSSPLGCGALAGSTLPLDRDKTAAEMGFSRLCANALDAISDRDFLLDFLHAASTGMMHLSRLSEELILWSGSEWNIVRIGDAFTTGSSLMPQKKNPDMAELIRGKLGRVAGGYQSLLMTLKGLPLSYNRDLQEDKEPVFDAYQTWSLSLEIMNGMLASMEVMTGRFEKELEGDFSLATDLADWLVLKEIPFREAHHIVGEVVKYAEETGKKLDQISTEELQGINPVFDPSALETLDIAKALDNKKTEGSPNPSMVENRIAAWLKSLGEQ